MRYWLKACPKCTGDLVRRPDGVNGFYIQCVQCGDELCPEQERALVRQGFVPSGLRPIAPALLPPQGRRYRMSDVSLETARDDLSETRNSRI